MMKRSRWQALIVSLDKASFEKDAHLRTYNDVDRCDVINYIAPSTKDSFFLLLAQKFILCKHIVVRGVCYLCVLGAGGGRREAGGGGNKPRTKPDVALDFDFHLSIPEHF